MAAQVTRADEAAAGGDAVSHVELLGVAMDGLLTVYSLTSMQMLASRECQRTWLSGFRRCSRRLPS